MSDREFSVWLSDGLMVVGFGGFAAWLAVELWPLMARHRRASLLLGGTFAAGLLATAAWTLGWLREAVLHLNEGALPAWAVYLLVLALLLLLSFAKRGAGARPKPSGQRLATAAPAPSEAPPSRRSPSALRTPAALTATMVSDQKGSADNVCLAYDKGTQHTFRTPSERDLAKVFLDEGWATTSPGLVGMSGWEQRQQPSALGHQLVFELDGEAHSVPPVHAKEWVAKGVATEEPPEVGAAAATVVRVDFSLSPPDLEVIRFDEYTTQTQGKPAGTLVLLRPKAAIPCPFYVQVVTDSQRILGGNATAFSLGRKLTSHLTSEPYGSARFNFPGPLVLTGHERPYALIAVKIEAPSPLCITKIDLARQEAPEPL